MPQFAIRFGRAIAVTALLGGFLSIPLHEVRAQGAAQTTQAMAPEASRALDRVENRIKELHYRLNIAAAQESLWGTVAQTMRDNAATLHASLADQLAKRDTMTAIDDLKSFQIIADEHSNGLKKFIPAFEALYASMTPAQQKQADRVFRVHRRHSRF
jgi:LTXXQ motif family protein